MGDGDDHSKELRRLSSVDALSELVWSPRNGLSLRCADFSFTGKARLLSPSAFDDIAQTNNNMEFHSKSNSVQLQEEEEEAGYCVNQACNEKNRPLSGVGGSVEDAKPEREEVGEDKVETNDDFEEAETRVGTSKRSLDSPRGIRGETEALLANEQVRLERAGSQEEPTNLGDSRADPVEATDENDLPSHASKALVACESNGECLPQDETDTEKAGPSGRRLLTKAKGKEKALSGENSDDESFGSVESCNSAGLLSRGRKKRPGFEQQLILGSKRLKTLSQECLESTTSKLNRDSSFMNWISNMTKGIWKGNEEDSSPFVALTTTTSDANGQQVLSGCRNTGFQSFFQSIHCPKKNDASLQELPEQCLITKRNHVSGNGVAPVAAEPNISSGIVRFNQTSETFQGDKEPNMSLLPLSKSKPSEEQNKCGEGDEKISNKNSGLESLWISRFSSKSYFPQKQDRHERITKEVAKEANVSQNAILPIVSSLRVQSSEAMASLFARRLEAMKHMLLPTGSLAEYTEERDGNLICFYCGKNSHRLQECLQVTDTELRDLVRNISARNGREEASTLCIRCFQLSHWAVACPNAPLYSSGPKLPFNGITDVPKAVFEAVQVLRLTRTDVLKWINSKKSVSGLEGFFLRLRLGKWAEGLGGTGYHVARIEGGQSSKKQHPVKSSVSVKVGGMICFVESQFISNHDFLEEELLAWWRSAAKSAVKLGGDDIPIPEELSRKIQKRKMLGI